MDNENNFSKKEIDILREVGEIGVGQAETSLSEMTGKKVEINLSETKFVSFESFADEIGGPEKIILSVYLSIEGELKGECLFIYPREGAVKLIDLVMNKNKGDTVLIKDLELSAFKETANIFTGSYLNALSKMLDVKMIHSIPHVATDMAQAVIDYVLIKIARTSDDLLLVKTKINVYGDRFIS